MSILITLLVLAALCGFIIWFLKPPEWASIAPDLGLKATRKGVEGWIDGWLVEIRKEDGFEITVGKVTPGFSIEPGALGQRFLKFGCSIGDDGFDAEVKLEGDRSFALALLRPEVRESILHLVTGQGGSISDGRIVTHVQERSLLVEIIPLLIDLAGLLRQPPLTALASSVRDVVTSDDRPSVRLAALVELRDVLYGSPEGLEAARALRHEPDHELRQVAASMLLQNQGEDQEQGVEMMQELLLTPSMPSEDKLTALATLISWVRGEAVLPVLATLLEAPIGPAVREAAIRACRRYMAPELLFDFAVEDDDEWLLVIEALVAIGDKAAQPRLIEGLDQEDRRVRVAAAKALNELGGLEAIPALVAARKKTENRGLLKAIDKARNAIRDRVDVSGGGEVSVIVPEPLEGALSPAASEGGELSLED